jgi:hypothetical protein
MSSWDGTEMVPPFYPSPPILVLVFSIELFQGTAQQHRRGEPWESIEIGRSPVAGHTISNVDIGGACHRPQPRLSPGLAITPRVKRTRSGAAGRSVSRGGEHGLMKVRKTNSTFCSSVRRACHGALGCRAASSPCNEHGRQVCDDLQLTVDMRFRTLARLAMIFSVLSKASLAV